MFRMWKRIKFVFNFRRSIPFLWDFFISREVSAAKKLLSAGILAGYLFFPFDLIPDFIMFWGIVDDITVFTFLLQQIVKIAPESLKRKHRLK